MFLQPSSLAFAKRDPCLPGLRFLLDEAALARHLLATKVTRIDLRYKPGVSCAAGLRVVGGAGDVEWLCAKAFTAKRFEQIKQRTHWHTGRWRVKLSENHLVAFIPPQLDRKLKVLSKLLDPETGEEKLVKITGRSFAAPDLRIMRYKPNRRLVAQVTDHASGRKALLKVQQPAVFEAVEQGARVAMRLNGPKVLAADGKLGTIASEWLPGVSLCPIEGDADPSLFRLAGGCIAQHHQSSFDLRDLPRAAEIQSLHKVASDLSKILPDQSERLAQIEMRAKAALLMQAPQHGLTHGDLSADQIIANQGQVSVIDWDRAATGDQGSDIGSFLARLDMQLLVGLVPARAAADLKAAFLEGYRDHHALPVSYQAQHICHLVLLLTEPFRRQTAEWRGLTLTLMGHIEELLELVPALPADPALPHLAEALSVDVMGPLVKDQIRLSLTSPPKLYRHKPGKRAMIRYDCQAVDGEHHVLLSKMHSKGRDIRTPTLQTALRAAGLDGRSPAKTGVPRVVDVRNTADMWFMEHVPGTCLRDLQDEGQPEPFFRAGAALGHFHKNGVVPDRVWSRDQELEVLAGALAKAAKVHPAHQPRLKEMLRQAEDAMGALPSQQPTCIHRDFYPDQVIIDDDQIWLIDLDLAALGDPAIDVGNFLAHLAEYAIRRTGRSDAARPLETAFLNGYQSAGFDLPRRSVQTLKSISLMRHIYISQLFEDRQRTTEVLLKEPWLDSWKI
ncbi:aminoglycoside phosphotransferase family protein [Roseobacter weihaiensis]|uniref:aminoglycoside phosphotransferase family protein n=1 Tax=Roseobacter weihaiensis TaxID=2763262 RepID=UPI001D0A673F|nr:aminoglycoside phosphotransferase family protein [Roseobacter sp. H9]